ncbi:hypothetical protein AAG747_09040 [Rapidithrix thailandica]|uniref:Uncharacterized protein n=1 Tax=Rapidithrix thailandica TaxID=413964 RepID=A0AAW9RTG8_9BACT
MYTSYVGKKFLKIYNEREHQDLTAKEFFEEKFFGLFFQDHAHLMHVGNSPFFQKPKEADVKKYGSKSLAQLNNLQSNIANDEPNMAIFVGYAAKDLQGTTSGQLSSIQLQIDSDEMYASWIGEALAIGVSGGFIMLIDKEEVLWNLYEGWRYYRQYLTQTPNVKDKQIETWNGHWLCHVLDRNYNPDDKWENFQLETTNVQGNVAVPTNSWSKVVFALSKKYPSQVITSYAYNLSQTNTTLGFINLYLPEVRTMYALRDAIFLHKEESILKDKQIEGLQTFFNFKSACKLGTIGLKALEPDKLRSYMPKGSVPFAQGKDFKFKDETSYYDYQLYKLWITAMLNKTELLDLASQAAEALLAFEKTAEKGKTVFSRLVDEVKTASNIRVFIDKITEVLDHSSTNASVFKNVVEQIVKMPTDNFPLFITLIRFEYQYQKSQN